MEDSLYERLIEREIRNLSGADDVALATLNADSVRRRVAWFAENRNTFAFISEDLLYSAYQLLLTRFGISPEEAPIVSIIGH